MDNIASSPNTEKEIQRAEIDDLVQALHTFYEFANMPSMMIRHRRSNGEAIPEPKYIRVKSAFKAKKFKDDADALFCGKKYDHALLAYTECLRHAVHGSEIIAQAYANRSAASFRLGKYLECQNDITRACRAKYPKDKWEKLFERYERCCALRANPPNPTSDAVASSSNEAGESPEKPVEADVRIAIEEIDGEWREMCVDLTNPLLRRTSNKVRLECNEKWGRHMVASKYIKAGEILSCERYFCTYLPFLKERSLRKMGLRCSYCGSISYALIPCNLCNTVMYCSTYCYFRAFNVFHRIECRMLRSQELHGISNNRFAMMALRMLLVGTDQGAGLETLMKKMTMRDIFAEKVDPAPNKPFSSDYSDVLKLTRTFPKPLLTLNSNPGVVVRLILALQNTGYFSQGNVRTQDVRHILINQVARMNEFSRLVCSKCASQKRLTNTELFTALLLANHILSIRSSVFSLYQIRGPLNIETRIFGDGVPILHNMINHSCNPNVFYLTRYHENVLLALRPISKDEQIFITYGGCTYYCTSLRERQMELADPSRHLRFTCQCEACTENWPLGSDLMRETEKYLGIRNVEAEVKKFNEEFDPDFSADVEGMSRTEIRRVISRLSGWLHGNLTQPSISIIDCELTHIHFMKYLYDSLRLDTNRQELMVKEVSQSLITIHATVNNFLT